jgi:hypothetical protein
MIDDGACALFPFGGVAIGEDELLVLSWWYLYCYYNK